MNSYKKITGQFKNKNKKLLFKHFIIIMFVLCFIYLNILKTTYTFAHTNTYVDNNIYSFTQTQKEYNITQHIYKLRSNEELQKLNDNTIEFDEIDDLVNTYNATVRNNWNSYDANKDNYDIYDAYYDAYENLDALASSAESEVQAAMYRAQADSMRMSADNNVLDSTINFLNYYIVEKNLCLSTKTLFINYYKNNINIQIKNEELNEAKRQFESAKLNYEEGNITRVEYLSKLKTLRTAEADLSLASSNMISSKRNLIINCGKSLDSNTEIGDIKHITIDDISKISLYDDTIKAIDNNYQYDIYKRQLNNAMSKEMRTQNEINVEYAPNFIKSDVEEKYYQLMDSHTALYSYQTAYDYQEQLRVSSQKEYLQGKISEKEYKTAVYEAKIASLNCLVAQFDLDIAYENYKAVVSGLANAGNR